jgi:type I restriction enzyme S subunit
MRNTSIPTTWSAEPTLDLFYIKGRLGWKGLRASEFQEDGPFLITGTDFVGGKVDWSRSFHISDERFIESPEITVQPRDILITKDGTIGKVAFIESIPFPGKASLNSHLFLVRSRTKKIDQRFAFYIFQSYLFRRFIDTKQTGSTLSGLSQRLFEQFKVPLPPIDQQGQISEILSTVDEAIEQTEALIAKYQQIKAGLMHDLFTRGVTPDGQLRPTRAQVPHLYKESPLGWIPREWEVQPLGVLAEIVSGVTLGSKSEISDGVGVPYLRVANVQDGYFDLKEVKTIHVSRLQFEKLQLKFGDVLMNEGGDFDKLGRGSVWQEEIKPCIHQNHVFRVRPRDGELRSYFLAFWSQSGMGKKYFVMSSKQSTNLASINSTQLNRFPVALPSLVEQERIEVRIMALNGHVDSLGQELAKLRQQKHGLMHDLLTGRVRVKVGELEAQA